MTKCIGCRSCEVACNEQNGNPADLHWRRIGEIEGGIYPDTRRHYLSMGCNHCLDPDCLRGCPVNAYTKDPLTGIVLHSADACIGCQYCVWNCPYSVPQFNPERGVVGKCDMCHGRLSDGREPACVNACPDGAISIEIVNVDAWRADYSMAESPGMPAARQTISTTRITLPESSVAVLERVDMDRIRPEHAHLSLVFMTTLIQAVAGSLIVSLANRAAGALVLTLLLVATASTLNISIFHLGRPAYAWRAVKMWRRSWLSREVLLFGLFFGALASITAVSWLRVFKVLPVSPAALDAVAWVAAILGIAGVLASAFIYLVPARPSWNMAHTPLDFLLSAAVVGSTCAPLLSRVPSWMATLSLLQQFPLSHAAADFSAWPAACAATFWLTNQGTRLLRLHRTKFFEKRATASLLSTPKLRALLITSLTLVAVSSVFAFNNQYGLACGAAFGGVLLARYLFFVSVVPLNMALTFVRGGEM
ncbi:dimethyl sulfoxide reductase anchor subunit [Alloacidobacterium dinghuense]|uniref:Dimethyl sulfoxide reductase anchor subunit n=2 Tax=Alloacidobacterium dinghuense TaxID=2763107 RepID=A0A7G8BRJ7_9BACT|nr:dimethyl sulfoxide reductase anchor subunit [Alloacidobacterium dinghuense]